MESNYWKQFWNSSDLISKPSTHEKIGRTINGKAIGQELWDKTLSFIEKELELNSGDVLLDICAGSGAISLPFSEKVAKVVALDISQELLNAIPERVNIIKVCSDALEFELEKGAVDKIVHYFSLQHFTESQTIRLFHKIYSWMKPGGICLIGDIPDVDMRFDFFNKAEYESSFFENVGNETPIIGTWFKREFILKLGVFTGFYSTEIIEQPREFINSHYRFDVKLVKYG